MRNIIIPIHSSTTNLVDLKPSIHRLMIPFRDLSTIDQLEFFHKEKGFEIVLDLSGLQEINDFDGDAIGIAINLGIWVITIRLNTEINMIKKIQKIIEASASRPALVGMTDESAALINTQNIDYFDGIICGEDKLINARQQFGGSFLLILNTTIGSARAKQLGIDYRIATYHTDLEVELV